MKTSAIVFHLSLCSLSLKFCRLNGGCIGLDRSDWVGLDLIELCWIGDLDWIGLQFDRIILDWIAI